MQTKTYVTTMPNKAGAFLLASRIIAKHNGNIVRVSYNKAVDMHTLFIDVSAGETEHLGIHEDLESVGYLDYKIPEVRIIVVDITIPDRPGAVLPVLKILDRYDINISYINSVSNNTGYQDFKMGLLIENPGVVKLILEEVSELYPINIIEYDQSGTVLDNTIFYIRLANEMRTLMGLSTEKTMEFISESNRILQLLQDKGENPDKVFEYIRTFAYFISSYRRERFTADVEVSKLSDAVTLHSIQPPCGSNTYVLETADGLYLVDTGYAVYADEMINMLEGLFPGFEARLNKIFITHADIDHCGLLFRLGHVGVVVNGKSAENFRRQKAGLPDYREMNGFCLGYTKLNRIISGYNPPNADDLVVVDRDTPDSHDDLLNIGSYTVGDLVFDFYEGSGGHLYGETVMICRNGGVAFTGDNLVNISGFTPERAKFNSLAPYLMGSVNVDSKKAVRMREEIIELIKKNETASGKRCVVCGGHGPLSVLNGGKIENLGR